MQTETARVRDLALVAALQVTGYLAGGTEMEIGKYGKPNVVFLYPLTNEIKKSMGDYHFSRMRIDPKVFMQTYKLLIKQVANFKYNGEKNSPINEEGKENGSEISNNSY